MSLFSRTGLENGRKAIRVLHAVSRMDRGGIETFLMRVYRKTQRDRLQFDFLAHKPGIGAFDNEIRELGGHIHLVNSTLSPLAFPQYLSDLKSFFTKNPRYDVVHAHLNAFNGIFLSIAANAGVHERIAHTHTQSPGLSFRGPFWNIVKHVGRQSFTRRYACSEQAGLWAYGRKTTFSIIKNGIPLELFYLDEVARTQVRQHHGLEGRMVIGHVGAFRPDKNQTFLLDLLSEVRKSDESASLLLVGVGSEQRKVKVRAAELGLAEHVVFVGETSSTEKYYSAMDVFAFPSVDEGLGIVAIEAQASGLPCIMSTGVPAETAATDFAERLPLNGNSNVGEWATAILKWARKAQKRQFPQPGGLSDFDICRTARKLQDVYLTSYERAQS